MNRLVTVIIVFCLVVGVLWAYKEHQGNSNLGNGAVTAKDDGNLSSDASQGTDGGRVSNQPPADASKTQVAQSSSTEPVVIPAPGPANAALPPAADTVAPNPPNGLAFGGTGRYQWYRQGNLTWRVDTNDGAACIAFATMQEWSKQIVYTHGCGNS